MPQQPAAIITGAGSGIGRAVANDLATRGFDLAITARTESKLTEVAQSIPDDARCVVVPADLTEEDAPARVVAETVSAFGRVDALINVAGYASFCAIDAITPDAWRTTIDTNLSATVLMTAAAWPHLVKSGSGVIVNVSSLASVDPFPQFAMYAAAKVGVNMFTRCTTTEGEPHGLRAVCVAPGAVETPMLRGLFSENDLPASSTLSPNDVAKVVADCVTGDRTFESGETILLPSP